MMGEFGEGLVELEGTFRSSETPGGRLGIGRTPGRGPRGPAPPPPPLLGFQKLLSKLPQALSPTRL